jgi:RNA-binding protein
MRRIVGAETPSLSGLRLGEYRDLRVTHMADSPLTGAQRSYLRGLGQRLDAALKLGREGLTPGAAAELDRLLQAHELVKIRFLNADRDERAAAQERIATELRCACVGAVGHTALFYRANPSRGDARIAFPS